MQSIYFVHVIEAVSVSFHRLKGHCVQPSHGFLVLRLFFLKYPEQIFNRNKVRPRWRANWVHPARHSGGRAVAQLEQRLMHLRETAESSVEIGH